MRIFLSCFRLRQYQYTIFAAFCHADFCIPPKSNSVDPWYTDFYHYKERHLVECFFMKIKDYRRIAMRFEKLACRFLAFIHLAATLLWLA